MLKYMSAAIASIMLLGGLPAIQVFAAPVETTVFEDNFESYNGEHGLEETYTVSEGYYPERMSLGTDSDNRVLNVTLISPDTTTMVTKYFDKSYRGGDVTLSYSVKPASGLTTMFYLLNDGSVQEFPRFETDGKMYLDWSGTEAGLLGGYTAGVWYDVKVKLNLDIGTYDISVQEQGSDEEPVTKTGAQITLSAVNGLRMQVWTNPGGTSCYDNVSIKHEKRIPYTQDFEAVNAEGMELENGDPQLCKVVDCSEGYKKIYRLAYADGLGTPSLKKSVGRLAEGKLGVEADLKPVGKENCQANIFLTVTHPDGSTYYSNLIGFSCQTGVRIGWNGTELLEDYDGDSWYHIRFVIDVASGTADAVIYDGKGAVGTAFGVNVFEPGSIVENVYFQRWGNEFGALYIDNVNITDVPDEILKDGISAAVKDGAEEITELAALKAAAAPYVSVAYGNYAHQPIKAIAYIACYKDGCLTGIKEEELNVDANEIKGEKFINISGTDFAGADCVRVFIWDKEIVLMPLCEKLELR